MEWISIHDQLPPVADIILIYTPMAYKHTNRYRCGWLQENKSWRVCGSGTFIKFEDVTHWMRFPRVI